MAEKLSTGEKFEANPPDEKVQVLNKIAEVSYQQGRDFFIRVVMHNVLNTCPNFCSFPEYFLS